MLKILHPTKITILKLPNKMFLANYYNTVLLFNVPTPANETAVQVVVDSIGLFAKSVVTAWLLDKTEYIPEVIYTVRLVTTCFFICMFLYCSYKLYKKFK